MAQNPPWWWLKEQRHGLLRVLVTLNPGVGPEEDHEKVNSLTAASKGNTQVCRSKAQDTRDISASRLNVSQSLLTDGLAEYQDQGGHTANYRLLLRVDACTDGIRRDIDEFGTSKKKQNRSEDQPLGARGLPLPASCAKTDEARNGQGGGVPRNASHQGWRQGVRKRPSSKAGQPDNIRMEVSGSRKRHGRRTSLWQRLGG